MSGVTRKSMWDLPIGHGPVALSMGYGALGLGVLAQSVTVGVVALTALWAQTWLCFRYAEHVGSSKRLAPLPQVSVLNTRRNRMAVWLANLVLRGASPDYRVFVKNAIRLGLQSAAAPASPPHPQPPACGANEEKLK